MANTDIGQQITDLNTEVNRLRAELEQMIERAQGTADRAESKADAAQTTADTAVAKAVAAQQTANTAVAKADAAQQTANIAVAKANAAQSTANTGVSRADQALSRTLKMHMETDVLQATQTKTFTLGRRILGVWWAPQDESHHLAGYFIAGQPPTFTPVITGNVAKVLVTHQGGSFTRILWCVLYEE